MGQPLHHMGIRRANLTAVNRTKVDKGSRFLDEVSSKVGVFARA